MKKRWTEDEEKVLTGLWEKGLSIEDIAKALGRSRNSILGRANILGLPKRTRVSSRLKKGQGKKAAAPAAQTPAGPGEGHAKLRPILQLPGREPCEITGLAGSECRAPVRETPKGVHLFCGLPTGGVSKPYCQEHRKILYQPLGVERGRNRQRRTPREWSY
jgi:hypothetical protein